MKLDNLFRFTNKQSCAKIPVVANEKAVDAKQIKAKRGIDKMYRIPAFLSTVGATRTIALPDTIPVGTRVAVMVMSDEPAADNPERRLRFDRVMTAIQAAIKEGFSSPAISDAELDSRIDRARRATGS